jgi:cytochrome c553
MKVCLLLLAALTPLAAQPSSELFEKKIRPVLAAKCYACHSSKLKSPMGGLVLDTKSGLRKGGASGPVLNAAKPTESRLLRALQFTDPSLQMPPTGKLSDPILADFQEWIVAGAPDPRPETPVTAVAVSFANRIEKGRTWWAFQPVRELNVPATHETAWPRKKIDSFLLAKLEEAKLAPSPQADARTLIRRATLDLVGIAPTYEEVEAFANGNETYEHLIDKLLASPHYGERWGRYWLDVARYAEDNPTSEATNPPYPYAWRYRDWVIEAVNKDLPYDRFVKLQLAADQMPDAKRDDLRALGYVGAAPIYHKDARLSKDVIETLASDDWDERVDAVSRGLLGLTVACARCHDHKFDPIATKDYYALAGVFASTSAVQRPLQAIDPDLEKRFLFTQQRLIHLDYLAKLMTGEPGTKPEEAAQKVVRFRAEIARLKAAIDPDLAPYPEMRQYIAKFGSDAPRKRGEGPDPNGPFINAVYDSALWVDGGDPDLTLMDYRPAQPRDLPVFLRGSPSNPGEPAPRRFLSVLAKPTEPTFQHGSGRLDLAEDIFTDATPLAARVIVNRVWGWHFGKPLVATPSDYGTQGEKPTHPELLDDLAARFIANGWSLKWLHREIMLSAAYRQASRTRPDGEQADPTNRLLWRMNARRMDIEAFRDTLLNATGTLSDTMYGPSTDLDAAGNNRRTVYAKVSRSRLNTLLRLYDFSDPSQHTPGRDLTTTPLQQLFILNSGFMQDDAAALVKRVTAEPDDTAKVKALFRIALARDANPRELDRALSYLHQASLPKLAQALLATNELIFWP